MKKIFAVLLSCLSLSVFSQSLHIDFHVDSIAVDYIPMYDFYFARVTPEDFDQMIAKRQVENRITLANELTCDSVSNAINRLTKEISANGLDVRRKMTVYGKNQKMDIYISSFYVLINGRIYDYSAELRSIIEQYIEPDIPRVVFENEIDYGKIYDKEMEDTFHLHIYWDLGKVSLSEKSKCEIDSMVKLFNSLDGPVLIDICYWDYDCIGNSALLYKKRSYFLFDYLKDRLYYPNMHVYYSSVDCERWEDEHALPLHRTLFFIIRKTNEQKK